MDRCVFDIYLLMHNLSFEDMWASCSSGDEKWSFEGAKSNSYRSRAE